MEHSLQRWAHAQLLRLGLADGPAAAWHPLRVEASHRRFYRVIAGARTLIAMSSPPARENNAQFVTLAELFRQHGIGVPELLAVDANQGFFLMSDLGETHLEDVYATSGSDRVLPLALAALHRLQQIRDRRIPPYTRERFEDELDIYSTWCLGELLDLEPPDGLREVFAVLVDTVLAQPVCCVHRDFHCRNLLLTPAGELGVVDFQDALMGPASYDLASLLRDCYHRFPEPEVARWRDAWLAGTTLPVDPATFARSLDLTALQRQLKAVGIFARLSLRDGRDSHLGHMVPVLTRIGELAAGYPQLEALARHVANVLPRLRGRLGEAA